MNTTFTRPVRSMVDAEWLTIVDELTRRRFVGGLGAVATLLVAGCDTADEAAGRPTNESANGFPRTIEHAYGSTTVPERPERLVVVGYTDIDVALALGVTPVGYNDWFGTGQLNPWASPLVDGENPTPFEMTDGLPLERVLALEPDLVIATDGMTEEEYENLSRAVPTVGPISTQFWGTPWRDHVRRTATILGREQDGEKRISELESIYAIIRADHPEFATVTASYAWPSQAGIALYIGADDTRIQVLSELGFATTDHVLELRESHPDEFYVDLNTEELEALEADVLMMQIYGDDQRAAVESNPLFAQLDVVKRGDVIWNPTQVSDALSFGTVLSLPYVVDQLLPLIQERLEA